MTTTVETLNYHEALKIAEETGRPVSQVQDEHFIKTRPDTEQPRAVLDARKEREQLAKKIADLQAREAAAFAIAQEWDSLRSRRQSLLNEIGLAQQQRAGIDADVSGMETYVLSIIGNAYQPLPGIVNRVGFVESCRATAQLFAKALGHKAAELEKLNGEIAAFAQKHGLTDLLSPVK